ncbi:CAP domain-containing protein [Streptomyces sp. V3I7]|uniref:CAP domain-containing protein n=1 Tax=Streptomyces sp. V3I7 TaxID=3042278 RepID=UPI0027861C78|nr:CAP domain-containing protein [Streptomyces sp. V3I7]MDQ0988922.1 uncharacterized protein YkwD [Streptomyces sp. V3I7]
MGTHRKKPHYRRIVVAAAVISAVGVPSIAMACANWQDNAEHRLSGAGVNAGNQWNKADWYGDWDRHWNSEGNFEPASAASKTSKTPTASAHPTRHHTASPKPRATASHHKATTPAQHAHHPRTASPKPRATTLSAPPKPTASAAASASATATAPRPKSTPSAPNPTSTPTATASASTSAATATSTSANSSSTIARIVELVNIERSKVGCQAVTLNSTLNKAAQAHSADMAAHQNMSHTGSDGSSPADRITRAGYAWSAYGENVAYGYSTPDQVMAGWMSSPGHKANILNCSFNEIGVGLAQPGSYWTQDFATAR